MILDSTAVVSGVDADADHGRLPVSVWILFLNPVDMDTDSMVLKGKFDQWSFVHNYMFCICSLSKKLIESLYPFEKGRSSARDQ